MARRYASQQNCPIARTLDLIGDRWTLLVVRDLLEGRTRFTDLLESLEGISPNLLSARLKTLEQAAVVERAYYSEHPPRAEYRLTAKGRALDSIVRSMEHWGREHAPPPAESRGRRGRRAVRA